MELCLIGPPTTVIHRHSRHNSSSGIAPGSLTAQWGPRRGVHTVPVTRVPMTTENQNFGIANTQCRLDSSVELCPIGLLPFFSPPPPPPVVSPPHPPSHFTPLLTLSQAGLLSGGSGRQCPIPFRTASLRARGLPVGTPAPCEFGPRCGQPVPRRSTARRGRLPTRSLGGQRGGEASCGSPRPHRVLSA